MLALLKSKIIHRYMLIFLSVLASLFIFITYGAIARRFSFPNSSNQTILLLVIADLAILTPLTILIARRLLSYRKSDLGKNSLRLRMITSFSLIASVPVIFIAFFSVVFFNYGIESWFNKKVSTAIRESSAVATAYLAEHKDNMRADILFMANDLDRNSYEFSGDVSTLEAYLSVQLEVRSLTNAVIFNHQKKLIAASVITSGSSLKPNLDGIDEKILERVDHGDVVILPGNNDSVRAVIKLQNFLDSYLLVGKFVDNKVLAHIAKTTNAADEYSRLQHESSMIQVNFALMFLMIALALLLVVVAFCILYSGKIVNPLSAIVLATEAVKSGDLAMRLPEPNNVDEIGLLGQAFNRMIIQLERQRYDLLEANRQIDQRRNFIETVIASVSAGIIVLNKQQQVTLVNHSAISLLGLQKLDRLININDLPAEFIELLRKVETELQLSIQQVTLLHRGLKTTLNVKIMPDLDQNILQGFIIYFDDISSIISAQRNAAWADVARRIAHEIKNPLTPIHLATERLKKKYSHYFSGEEGVTYTRYLDTIIAHVKNITTMVEEFVNFARMPIPNFSPTNLINIIENTVFSQKCLSTGTKYVVILPQTEKVMIYADESQLSRVLQNLLKNAEEAMEHLKSDKEIVIKLLVNLNNQCQIIIEDNGPGFPEKLIDRLTEPYVTTRSKGSGLGLAIVRKIIEEHSATINLANNAQNGACVEITIPLYNIK